MAPMSDVRRRPGGAWHPARAAHPTSGKKDARTPGGNWPCRAVRPAVYIIDDMATAKWPYRARNLKTLGKRPAAQSTARYDNDNDDSYNDARAGRRADGGDC